jgi:transcriptional regulator with XRE-family HTH domain
MAKIIVREILKEKGISIKVLAGMMGISPSAVSQLLANPCPSLQVLERIANAIGVDVVDFFAQGYSYLNGYIETGEEIYPVRSREQFMGVIGKVDGIVHIPSFARQDHYKNSIQEFLSTSITTGQNNAIMARYGVREIFTLTYDAISERLSLTLCIGDGEIRFRTFSICDYRTETVLSRLEMIKILEDILTEIEMVDNIE